MLQNGLPKWLLRTVALLFLSLSRTVAVTVLETLPGYPGKLPFMLETGYISVGDLDDIQLFYYFIESEGDPVRDPLLLWLTGGPGCSGFSGLVYEIGPLTFDYASFNGSLPTFLDNPYSWTKVASIIFLDEPVGTGFSYSTTQEGYYSTDKTSAVAVYQFLRKWLIEHPRFSKVPLYTSGDSYSGMIVPQVALLIHKGNAAGLQPQIELQGYILGNPVTDSHSDQNSRVPYAYQVGLISSELYKSISENCNGEYIYPDISNSSCMADIELVARCTINICDAAILEPKCSFDKPNEEFGRLGGLNWGGKKFFDDDYDRDRDFSSSSASRIGTRWCRNSNYVLSYIWANDETVQEALGIRNGSIPNWMRCNKSLAYDYDLNSTVSYHFELISAGYRALVYSGDHDMLIPHVGTQSWLFSLNMTVVDTWRPWFVDGQISGYTVKSTIDIGDGMTYATVKGAGHTAPEYNPKECLRMVDRFLSRYAL
ncbi:hypothetical protein MLD38_032142 [Melastoma candidum]|uniref:Uncharacterized protein n=1 Tax=Melastoma candidum TaxID=119954 RepID=A0ACB9M4Z5_9MYRT|nr:hypothetical protein MLD38_032142 [Melastoma candidum]